MDVTKILEVYPIPISIVVTLLLAWGFNKFIAPNLGQLSSLFSAGKDQEIKGLKEQLGTEHEKNLKFEERLNHLESECNKIKEMLSFTQVRESRFIGLLTGLNIQLKTLGIDIAEEIKEIEKIGRDNAA